MGTASRLGLSRHRVGATDRLLALVLITALVALLPNLGYGGPVNTAIYSTYTDNYPNGVNFAGSPVDSISTADFQQFGSAISWNWHPDSLATFAADTIGNIQVSTADTFTFILAGAQDSFCFVDGTLVVPHGSDAVAQSQNTISLGLGSHTIEVQYDIVKPQSQFPADTQSGWELSISPANEYSIVSTPEPSSVGLSAGGLLLFLHRRRRSVKV